MAFVRLPTVTDTVSATLLGTSVQVFGKADALLALERYCHLAMPVVSLGVLQESSATPLPPKAVRPPTGRACRYW